MRLSSHFLLSELTKSQTAERLGIENRPSSEAVENLIMVCEMVLEPIRRYFEIPFSPSSGFRCLELNRAIGSSDTSQHILGQAVDFEIPGIPNKETALWVRDNCVVDQLMLEFYHEGEPASGWIHASFVSDRNRQTARVFDGREWSDLR